MKHNLQWAERFCYKHPGGHFNVEITHSKRPYIKGLDKRTMDEQVHSWCLYVYIFESHPLFKSFKKKDDKKLLNHPVAQEFPGHNYCSYFQRMTNHEKKQSIHLGWDYSHVQDEVFLSCNELCWAIKSDAFRLIDYMAEALSEAGMGPSDG